MLLLVSVLPTFAQELETKIKVEKVESRTNPDFIKRLADPAFNPELARRIPDANLRLISAQTTTDQYCGSMNASLDFITSNQGCYLEITYSHTYTYNAGSTNANTLPHGLFFETCFQTIESVSIIQGQAWLSGTTPVINANSVYWVKDCTGDYNYNNIIPSGQTIKIRIKLATGFCPGPCQIKIRELNGWAFPSDTNFWTCEKTINVNLPPSWVNYSIGSDTSVCTGQAFNFNVSALPPSFIPIPQGATVKWYKYIPNSCTAACPPAPICTIPVGSPWVLDATSQGSYNTNILTQTTCYVAVVEFGCIRVVTNVKKVTVSPGPPSATITTTTTSGISTIINGVPHACSSWSGKLCLTESTSECIKPKIIGWQKRARNLSYTSPCNPVWGNWSSWGATATNSLGETCINTGILQAMGCQTQYEFKAFLINTCGQSEPTFTIIIDRPPVPGTITANPLPVLCFDKATKLTISPTCGEVVEWEMREEVTPCLGTGNYGPWIIVPGSQGTCIWWTGNLQNTTQYRVKVKNGACLPINSPIFTVKVKPKLAVTISAIQTVLCTPVTLTAQTTYEPCGYLVTYQWYKDGLPIPGATLPTYNPTIGGNYYVVVKDICGNATSNVITVCGKPRLVIEAPCCVCPGEPPITLKAIVLWTPSNCPQSCTYLWKDATGATIGTTPIISVNLPGIYTVTVSCGTCPPMTQSVIIKPCL